MHAFDQYYYKSEHPVEEGYECEANKVFVYKFPSKDLCEQFIQLIGGQMHPLGGLRVIISDKEQ